MDAQGRIVLPQNVRGKGKKYFTCQTEKDGTVHLIPVVGVITAKQAYFWTKRWQEGEKKATQALRMKKYKVVTPKKLDEYLSDL
jgi:hypothetical protein